MGQLAAKVRAKFPGAYDDIDDATLEKQVLLKHPEYADLGTPSEATPLNPELARLGGAAPDELSRITPMASKDRFSTAVGGTIRRNPAAAGAMLGGALAAPFTGGMSVIPAMATTGVAGFTGANLGMMASAGADPTSPVPRTTTGVLKRAAIEGAGQAGAEGIGRGIQAGLKEGASRLYQSLLKPTKAARLENPTLIPTALANKIPISTSGAEQAGELVKESMGKADQLVSNAEALGAAPIEPTQAVRGIRPAVAQAGKLPVAQPQRAAIGNYGKQYLAEHSIPTYQPVSESVPSAILDEFGKPFQTTKTTMQEVGRQSVPMPLTKAQESVKGTDKFFNKAYRATIDKGDALTVGKTAAAVGINDETRNLLREAVPGLQAQNKVTQGLEGLRQAIADRVGQRGNNSIVGMQHLINAGLGGAAGYAGGKDRGIETFLAMEALTNPAIASRLAIAAHGAARWPTSAALRAALLARLAGNEQDHPPEETTP